jgi:flavin-binding protein dodecin
MTDHVYKSVELTGTSSTDLESAVRNALVKAKKTVRNMRWFELVEVRGAIDDGDVGAWQVTIKVGFTLDD